MASFIRGPALVGAASCRERAMKLSYMYQFKRK